MILTIEIFQNYFYNTFLFFFVPSRLIGLHPQRQLSASGFILSFQCPGSEGVDAFSVDWVGENNWMVPPVYLISRTTSHLVCRGHGLFQSGRERLFDLLFFYPVSIFRALCNKKNGSYSLRDGSKLSYSRAGELFI